MKIVFEYAAVQGADGKFTATLKADGATVDSATGIKNEATAKNWAEAAAIAFKRTCLNDPKHGTTRTAYGTFEL